MIPTRFCARQQLRGRPRQGRLPERHGARRIHPRRRRLRGRSADQWPVPADGHVLRAGVLRAAADRPGVRIRAGDALPRAAGKHAAFAERQRGETLISPPVANRHREASRGQPATTENGELEDVQIAEAVAGCGTPAVGAGLARPAGRRKRRPYVTHSPDRMTGSVVPSLWRPSTSSSPEPIMKSTCVTLRLPPARSKSSSLISSPPDSVDL